MATKVRTNIYLDYDVKLEAREIFKKYGVSLSEAINMFLKQSIKQQCLPFEMNVPNDETIKAIKEARENINSDIITFEELEKEVKQCLQ